MTKKYTAYYKVFQPNALMSRMLLLLAWSVPIFGKDSMMQNTNDSVN